MANRITFDDIPSFLEKNLILKKTVRGVFNNLRENYQTYKKVTDEDLLSISSIFGETFEKALEIVEDNKVVYYHINPNSVGIYQIEGSLNKTYTIYPSVNYCSCFSYKYQVARGFQITCKHVLATVIAEVSKMNDREDWHTKNPYLQQFAFPTPAMPGIPATISGIPGIPAGVPTMSPGFGPPPPNNWLHVPPQTMPWGQPPESHPPVVRFTAGDFSSHFQGNHNSFKRKCDSSIDMPPAKMLVTEEKMAAHMRNLHISEVDTNSAPAINCKDDSMETDRLPRLVLSNEIKNIKTEPIIPESILKKFEKPEMALVLWQPPATDLGSKLKELRKLSKMKSKDKEKENKSENKTKTKDNEMRDMDVVMEAETENNNVDSMFRPIDPVPMPVVQQNQFFQPIPQFHGYSPFS